MSAFTNIITLNRCKWLVAIFVISNNLFSQQTYFQQEVNYKIDVILNDKQHSISATEEIQYINNSDQSLTYIYFHLWPNAYKNHSTALAKQLLQQNKTNFYFSKPEERGFIDSLDFKVNGKSIKIEFDVENIDICKLVLNEPLRSLDTILINTPFFVKIPDAKFSRLGHDQQAYFITQWYPKPAVFDKEGWHQMPYLDQGEFFSEFGSFDVKITVPKNYLLAATGDRIDAEEEENFLNEKVIQTLTRLDKSDFREEDMSFPESSKETKTIRFKQYRVHDFAWFADKRFNVLHDQIELPGNKKTVDTWIFFTNKNFELWKNAINYVNESTIFYSYLIGDYPYNHVTAVDGTIMAGGGMEYPTITVIGNSSNEFELDITIAHEVGHNWFYGILGSNERDYPFMDEGLNSFYEMRYMRAKYPEKKLSDLIGLDENLNLFGLNKVEYWREKEMAYFMSAKARRDQPLNISSSEYSGFNYGSIVYSKAPVIFDYLMDYMDEENLDKAMQFYYEQFKFTHPSPKNLSKTLSFFNGIGLSWFSTNLISSTDKIDYKIKNIKKNKDGSYSIKLKNKTGVVTPLNVYGFKNNKPVGLIWYDGFEKNETVEFPAKDVDYFKIDGLDKMPDINRKNNYIKARGLFKKAKPLQFNFLTKFENPAKTQINYVPIIGANYYNGFMVGASIHNYSLYQKRFEYSISPMFAFKTMSPVGFSEFNFNFYPKKIFQQITLGAKAKSFTYDYYDASINNSVNGTNYKSLNFNFLKIAPYLQFEIKKKNATSPIHQFITYTNSNLFTDSLNSFYPNFIATAPPTKTNNYSFVNQLNYFLNNKRAINPFAFNFELQHNASMSKISATLNYQITISKKHFVDVRLFAGTFLSGSYSERSYYAFRASGYNGYQDYLFETNFIARNEYSGFGFSQFADNDGALKVWTPLGQSPEWLASVNLKSPKIFILPAKIFVDLAVCDGRSLNKDAFLWDAGLNVTIVKDIIDVYIPFMYSNDIKKTLELNNVSRFNTIRFTINIHKLVPKNLIRDNLF
ncbi:MAG: M1 family metallopeptidase [Bacteroidota bacterium]|nr:M1 family metallopeptidase [Bacteroidota bacterium]MDP3145140.1 M1 family metallopeptidase [Bacteroidota bacterium]